MFFLPAAALCCLCSALVVMAADLIQEDLTLTRRAGENVSFSCGGIQQCGYTYIFWYQKKDTETFKVILDIDKNNGDVDRGYNHPQKDDFSSVNKPNGYEQVVKPVVSVYPAASRAHLEGKSSLLCLASAMSPPLVQFSWKRQKENGPLEELLPAEGEQLELREPGRTASILLLHQQEKSTYKYRCSVKHEGGTVEAQTEQVSFPSQYQVLLLCLLYTVLIVKSLVYCCGLSLLRILRNKGPSTNFTHAD
ncbi:hypothetical protein PAMP_005381 [Pampus punctatissimus]